VNASVVIPVKNGSCSITEALSALTSQSLKPAEIIVVDDGSTDDTVEKVKKFEKTKKLKNLKLISQNSAGPAAARNNGAKQARAEFLVFIDADCVPERDWLKEMLSPFSDPKVAGVQGAYKSSQKELMARFTQIEIEDRYHRMIFSKDIDWIGSYSAAYRRLVFLELKGFDKEFRKASGEDPDLSFSIQEHGHKLVFNPRAIVYHSHPTSLRSYLRKKFQHAKWRVLLYKRHTAKAVSDSYTPQSLKAQIVLLWVLSIAAPASLAVPELVFFSWLTLFLLILLMFPFVFFALKRDFLAGLASPFILFLRNIVFLWGLIAGIINLAFSLASGKNF